MGSSKITFPVVGKGVRRNAETGVEIRSTKLDRGGMEHSVYAPDRDPEVGMRLWDYFGELSSARDEATDRVQMIRDQREADHSDAITENAYRALAKHDAAIDAAEDIATLTERGFTAEGRDWRHADTGVEIIAGEFLGEPVETYEVRIPDANKFGYVVVLTADTLHEAADEALGQVYSAESALAVDTDPAVAAEVAEANGLDEQATAELTEHARKQFPSVAAMLDAEDEKAIEAEAHAIARSIPIDGRPAEVTRMLEAAELLNDERENLAALRAARKRYDEIMTEPATLPEGVELIEFGAAEPSSYVYMLSGAHVEDMPKMEIAKRPRERVGRNGHRLAGWSVRIGGTEIDRATRKADARARLDRWLAEHLRTVTVKPEPELPPLKTIDARPARSLPVKTVRHGDVVTFAPTASQVPADVPGATAVSPWKIDGTDTINRAPGGRIFVHVWQSFNDPKTGFSTRVAAAWLDELRTEGGAARVTLPGFPTA